MQMVWVNISQLSIHFLITNHNLYSGGLLDGSRYFHLTIPPVQHKII